MAEGKKSFVLYTDLIHTVRKMPKDLQGDLFMTILEYVNDENPKPNDLTIELVFEGIKQQLKRDLKKFEEVKTKRSEAGKRSAKARALKKEKQTLTNSTSVKSVEHSSTNPTVNDNDNVNDNVNVDTKVSIYTEREFLNDWKELRERLIKKPTNITKLSSFEFSSFTNLTKQNKKDNFVKALNALFRQEVIKFSSMQSRPKHFFEYFDQYLTAYDEKDTTLWGQKKKEETL